MQKFTVHTEDTNGNEKTFSVSALSIGAAHAEANLACDKVVGEAVTYITPEA